jgi:hypothetical protein
MSVQDQNSSYYNVGDVISVRCIVNSISGGQGAGGEVNLTVETPGVVGQISNVNLSVSPVQCRRMNGVAGTFPTSSQVGPVGVSGDQALDSSHFAAGDVVGVLALVTAITGVGAGARVTATVLNSGNVGEVIGVTLTVGPQQTRRSRAINGTTLPGA